jgi:hypothetical protein
LTVTLSVVLALSVVVFLLCRYAALRMWHAAICIVLGFYLASSSLAPDTFTVVVVAGVAGAADRPAYRQPGNAAGQRGGETQCHLDKVDHTAAGRLTSAIIGGRRGGCPYRPRNLSIR